MKLPIFFFWNCYRIKSLKHKKVHHKYTVFPGMWLKLASQMDTMHSWLFLHNVFHYVIRENLKSCLFFSYLEYNLHTNCSRHCIQNLPLFSKHEAQVHCQHPQKQGPAQEAGLKLRRLYDTHTGIVMQQWQTHSVVAWRPSVDEENTTTNYMVWGLLQKLTVVKLINKPISFITHKRSISEFKTACH
jgi:hypothetical protein